MTRPAAAGGAAAASPAPPPPPEGAEAAAARRLGERRYCPRCGAALEAGRGPGGLPACPRCGFVRRDDPKLAAGVVAERGGRVLLVRRNHEPMYGRWTFPSGFVDAGETVEAAARREAREETGAEVTIEALLGVWSAEGDPVVFVAYAGRAEGEPAAGDEALEVGLFAPDALPDLAFPHDAAILAAWEAWRSGRASATMAPARAEPSAGGDGAGSERREP